MFQPWGRVKRKKKVLPEQFTCILRNRERSNLGPLGDNHPRLSLRNSVHVTKAKGIRSWINSRELLACLKRSTQTINHANLCYAWQEPEGRGKSPLNPMRITDYPLDICVFVSQNNYDHGQCHNGFVDQFCLPESSLTLVKPTHRGWVFNIPPRDSICSHSVQATGLLSWIWTHGLGTEKSTCYHPSHWSDYVFRRHVQTLGYLHSISSNVCNANTSNYVAIVHL